MQAQADRREQIPTVLSETRVDEAEHLMTSAGLTAKHVVDFLLALFGLICLAPLLLVIAILSLQRGDTVSG